MSFKWYHPTIGDIYKHSPENPDPVFVEANRLSEAKARLDQLQAMRQAKTQMIATWQQEIREIDEEVQELIKRDPHLAKYGYPQWLVELM